MDAGATLGRFDWLGRDARILIAARALRAFAQGFLSVLLAIYLAEKGLALGAIGLFFSAGVFGGAVQALALNALVSRFGRRPVLIGLTLTTALFSFGLTATNVPGLLFFLAFAGALAGVGGAGGAGPTQPVEQAILADVCEDSRHASAFAVYRFISTVATALGGAAAALPSLLEAQLGMETLAAQNVMVGGYALLLLFVSVLYAGLGRAVERETQAGAQPWVNPLRTPSRRLILGLNGLFGIDQLSSAITTSSLVAYWFHTYFGLSLDTLAAMAFGSQALAAFSMWLSVKLSARIGYVRTMVYTHIPASLMLIGIAFAPSAAWAVGLFLARSVLSQMDIPARDALTMSVVAPDERVAMASLHLVSRNGFGTIGPTISTSVWQGISAAAPLVLSGVLKVVYDISLYAFYRDVESRRKH